MKILKYIKGHNKTDLTLEQYVNSLEDSQKKEFVDEIKYVIDFLKPQYRKNLKFHLVSFLLLALTYILIKQDLTPQTFIAFFISWIFFGTMTIATVKKWKLIRKYKLIKKNIQIHWLGEAYDEDDDKEFFTRGKRFK